MSAGMGAAEDDAGATAEEDEAAAEAAADAERKRKLALQAQTRRKAALTYATRLLAPSTKGGNSMNSVLAMLGKGKKAAGQEQEAPPPPPPPPPLAGEEQEYDPFAEHKRDKIIDRENDYSKERRRQMIISPERHDPFADGELVWNCGFVLGANFFHTCRQSK